MRLLRQLEEQKKRLMTSPVYMRGLPQISGRSSLRTQIDRECVEKMELKHRINVIAIMNSGEPLEICSWRRRRCALRSHQELWWSSKKCDGYTGAQVVGPGARVVGPGGRLGGASDQPDGSSDGAQGLEQCGQRA